MCFCWRLPNGDLEHVLFCVGLRNATLTWTTNSSAKNCRSRPLRSNGLLGSASFWGCQLLSRNRAAFLSQHSGCFCYKQPALEAKGDHSLASATSSNNIGGKVRKAMSFGCVRPQKCKYQPPPQNPGNILGGQGFGLNEIQGSEVDVLVGFNYLEFRSQDPQARTPSFSPTIWGRYLDFVLIRVFLVFLS